MQENIVALVTVRSGSTRLKMKFKREFYGKPMMERVVDAVRESGVDEVVVATVYADTPVIQMCYEKRIEFFAGEENDLVNRLYLAGKAYNAEIVVRIWGDSPLVMPKWIDYALMRFKKTRPPYYVLTTRDAVIAVTPLSELERLNEELKDPKTREWIHAYQREQEGAINIVRGNDRTVDTLEDLRWARRRFLLRREKSGIPLYR